VTIPSAQSWADRPPIVAFAWNHYLVHELIHARISGLGAAMSIGLYRLELGKFGWSGGSLSDRCEVAMSRYLRPRLVFLLAILFAVVLGGLVVSGDRTGWAESESAPPAPTTIQPAAPPSSEPAAAATPTNASLSPSPLATSAPPAVNGLKIYSQSWRRGGLGSNALFTFTLRNNNDYAVKDVEILCAFTRRDGSHLTDRMRVIPDTIEMKTRKTFTRLHVGFVNINASKAICSLVTANRI
jgi:hypothetical protein